MADPNMEKHPDVRSDTGNMKRFACRDAGVSCDWSTQGQSDEEIMKNVQEHARTEHKDIEFNDKMKEKVRSLIRPVGKEKAA